MRGQIIDPAIRSWELAASYAPLQGEDHDRSILVVYDPILQMLKEIEKERGLPAPPL